MAYGDWNKKISGKRGKTWIENMIKGRRDAITNPSNIRLVRLKEGLQQEAVAKKAGMSIATFGGIERGKRPVKEERARRIASVLRKPLDKLFKKTPKNKFIAISQRYGI